MKASKEARAWNEKYLPGARWRSANALTADEARERSLKVYICELCEKKAWYRVGRHNYCRDHKEAGIQRRIANVTRVKDAKEQAYQAARRELQQDWQERRARRSRSCA